MLHSITLLGDRGDRCTGGNNSSYPEAGTGSKSKRIGFHRQIVETVTWSQT